MLNNSYWYPFHIDTDDLQLNAEGNSNATTKKIIIYRVWKIKN